MDFFWKKETFWIDSTIIANFKKKISNGKITKILVVYKL